MINLFKTKPVKNKVGLVLGSGGAKGLSHVSVIEYLEENDIKIEFVSGSSIGALIGAMYCRGPEHLQRFKNDLLRLDRSVYMKYFEPVFPVSGLLNIDTMLEFVKNYIPENLEFSDLQTPLCVVATDYANGKQVLFRSGSVLTAVRASISIPGIFLPLKMDNTLLIDGGVANPLPIDVVREMGAKTVIAVNLHPRIAEKNGAPGPTGNQLLLPEKEEMKASKAAVKLNPLNFILDKAVSFAQQSREFWDKNINAYIQTKIKNITEYPNIFEIILQTIDIMGYSNTVMMLKYDPPDVLIEPELTNLRSLDFDKAGFAFSEGRNACLKVKSALKEISAKK